MDKETNDKRIGPYHPNPDMGNSVQRQTLRLLILIFRTVPLS